MTTEQQTSATPVRQSTRIAKMNATKTKKEEGWTTVERKIKDASKNPFKATSK